MANLKAPWVPWAGLALGVLLFAGYIKYVHDPAVVALAGLSQKDRIQDSLLHQQDRLLDSLNLVNDSLAQAARRVLHRDTVLVRHVDTLIVKGDSSAAIVIREVPDSIKQQTVAAFALKDSVIASLQASHANLLGVIALQTHQIALRDTALTTLKASLATALQQEAQWRKQAKVGFGKKVVRSLPVLAVGVAVGVLLH